MVKEFEKEYREEAKEIRWQKLEEEEKEFSQELPREFIAKLVYGEEEEIGRKLEQIKKFLRIRNLERGAILWVGSKEGKYLLHIHQLDGKPLEI